MVAPAVAAVGAQLIIGGLTAAAQYYQAEKTAKASQQKLDEIKAIFDSLKPPELQVSIEDPPELIAKLPELRLEKGLPPLPQFDFKKITPEKFKLIGKYIPQLAPLIAEQKPELVKYTQEAKGDREAQVAALQQMRQAATMERDPALMASLDLASRRGQQEAQSRQANVLQDMARRGMLGSTQAMLAQMQAGSESMGQSAEQGRLAAIEAQRNRLQALRDTGTMGRQVAADEMDVQGRNVDIINQFNQRASTAAQQQANRSSDVTNQAQLANIDREQKISDANAELSNTMQKFNLARDDATKESLYRMALEQKKYLNDLTTQEHGAGVEGAKFGRESQQMGWEDRIQKMESENRARDERFKSEFDIAAQKAGARGQEVGAIQSEGKAKAGAIQSFGEAGRAGVDTATEFALNDDDDEEKKRKKKDWGVDYSAGGNQ